MEYTAKELIELLSEYPSNMKIQIDSEYGTYNKFSVSAGQGYVLIMCDEDGKF